MKDYNLKPIYQYAGGKGGVIPLYLENPGIPVRGYRRFVEPFFGGGAMTCWINSHNPDVEEFVISDKNAGLIGVYRQIREDPTAMIKAVDAIQDEILALKPGDERRDWYWKFRDEYNFNYQGFSPLEEYSRLYVLMRMAFRGKWSTKRSTGRHYTTPGRLVVDEIYRIYDCEMMARWGAFLNNPGVIITDGDWKPVVETKPGLPTFFFLDPPYRDSFHVYDEMMGDEEQAAIVKWAASIADSEHFVFVANRESGDGFWDDIKGGLEAVELLIKYQLGYAEGEPTDKHITKDILLHNFTRARAEAADPYHQWWQPTETKEQ